jgi:hypothetical protein
MPTLTKLDCFFCRFKAWNPDWAPGYFNIDKCHAEINAITDEFPSARILLCDFHRQQLLQRWVNSSDVPAVHKKYTLDL